MTVDKDIKTAMKDRTLVVGTRQVVRGVKNGTIGHAITAANCPEETRNDLAHYAGTASLTVTPYSGNSAQLGEICRKPFTVSVIGIRK